MIKKKKLIAKHAIGSVSGGKMNFADPNIGTDNDESKETKHFVPSPELSEDFSQTSITHDTYSVSRMFSVAFYSSKINISLFDYCS